MTQKGLADGSIVDMTPEEEAARDAGHIANLELQDRAAKYEEVKAYALVGITAAVAEWDTWEDVKFLASLGPLLNWGSATAGQTLAKDIALYAKNKLSLARTGPIDQVRAYDPATDVSWPT